MVEGNMLIVIFLLSLAALFFMILKMNIEPFVTLIVVAFVTALVLGFPLADIPGLITTVW